MHVKKSWLHAEMKMLTAFGLITNVVKRLDSDETK